MAKKVFAVIFKWLLVPVSLAFIGYAFIGPHIGRNPPSNLKSLASNGKTVDLTPQTTTNVKQPEGSGKEWPEPKVEVELRRLNGNRVEDRELSKQSGQKVVEPEKVSEDNTEPATPDQSEEQPPEDSAPPNPEEPPAELPDGPGA
ncbi:MAG: hypothetical protein JNK63_10755 [Chthonomonas sp.]|nr:hypothetical protein [Chthonomonas sp.]